MEGVGERHGPKEPMLLLICNGGFLGRYGTVGAMEEQRHSVILDSHSLDLPDAAATTKVTRSSLLKKD